MKKKKIEEIIGRLDSLLKENPKLVLITPEELKLVLNKIDSLKSEITALEKFFDEFRGVL